MKSFEPVYKRLNELVIEELPNYINKINLNYNDGIILKVFRNKKLTEHCKNLPSFEFDLEETEYSEKDRIIENTVFEVSFELKLQPNTENEIIILWRYFEAFELMIRNIDDWKEIKITSTKNNKIYIRITM